MDLQQNPDFPRLEPEFAIPVGLHGSGKPGADPWHHIDAGQALCNYLFADKDPREAVGEAVGDTKAAELDKMLAAAVAKNTSGTGGSTTSIGSSNPEQGQDENAQDGLNGDGMMTMTPTEADLDAAAADKEVKANAVPPPPPSPPASPEAAAAVDVLLEETVSVVTGPAPSSPASDVKVLAENDPKQSDLKPFIIIIKPMQCELAASDQIQIKEEVVEPPVLSIPNPAFPDDKTQGAQLVKKYNTRTEAVEFSQTEILTDTTVPLYLGKPCHHVSFTVAQKLPQYNKTVVTACQMKHKADHPKST